MRTVYVLVTMLAVSFVVAPSMGQDRVKSPAKPVATSVPASNEVITPLVGPIPDSVIKAIESQFSSEPKSIQDSITIMKNVLEMCNQAQMKYPDADNMSKIQVPMLQAASWVAGYTRDPAANEEMLNIARQILASKSPVTQKFSADVILTIASFQPLSGPAISNEEIEKNIRNFISRYEKTDVAPNAYMVGVRLATQAGLKDMSAEYVKVLEDKYPTNPRVKAMLSDMKKQPASTSKPAVGGPTPTSMPATQ